MYRIGIMHAAASDPPAALRHSLRLVQDGQVRDWVAIHPVDSAMWSTWRTKWVIDVALGESHDVLDEFNGAYDAALDSGIVPALLPRLCEPPQVVHALQVSLLRVEMRGLRGSRPSEIIETVERIAWEAERLNASLSFVIDTH